MSDVLLVGGGALALALTGLLAAGVASKASSGAQAPPRPQQPSTPPRITDGGRRRPVVESRQAQPATGQGPQRGPVTMDHVRSVSWQVVSVFETGKPQGRYDAFVILADGAGISAGKKQGTDRSDVFDAIVNGYIARGGQYAQQLRPFVARLARNESTSVDPGNWPQWVHALRDVFVAAASDPIMQSVQDDVFDRLFWQPAIDIVRELGLRTPLAYAVIFDTCIHSSPAGVGWIRRRFAAKPPADGGDERIWLRDYVQARRHWLATHDKRVLHATVYRMDLFAKLIRDGNWALRTPFTIDRPRAVIR